MGLDYQFDRHDPCRDKILFVLTLDRAKMKERILIGTELEIRFRLGGSRNADVLSDVTRPLGVIPQIIFPQIAYVPGKINEAPPSEKSTFPPSVSLMLELFVLSSAL